MQTILDECDELLYPIVRYDSEAESQTLYITIVGAIERMEHARYCLTFERPIMFSVLPEVSDAVAYSKDLFDYGWLKTFPQSRDPFEPHLMLTTFFTEEARHFVLVGRDELVHIVAHASPQISKEVIVNGVYR